MFFSKIESLKTKGVAILMLLFHHLFFMNRGFEINPWILSNDSLTKIAVSVRVCVWVFVFISVYGNTVLYKNKENYTISQFIYSRWMALMKGYWFVYVLAFLVMTLVGRKPLKIYNGNIINVVLDFFAWSDFFETPTLSGSWWYMCLAQILLLIIPIFVELCKKMGGASCIIIYIGSCFLTNGIVSKSGGNYLMYLMVIVFGVICVQYDFFRKIKLSNGFGKIIQWLLIFLAVVILIAAKGVVGAEDFPYNSRNFQYVFYSLAAVGICILVMQVKITIIEEPLKFLGKHSGNIFLVHMFLVRYLGKYVYCTKTVLGTFLILLTMSLIISVLIEKVKKLVDYNRIFEKCEKR